MLSYQHIYHAGNIIDVHKHFILANLLDNLLKKNKQFSYLETHAGRGIYNLDSTEANKTKEYKYGIKQVNTNINNIYFNVLNNINMQYKENIYPGSAKIAQQMLPNNYLIYLCELHKLEYSFLVKNITGKNINIYNTDGLSKILQISPLLIKRGLVFIDPSYDAKQDYINIINFIKALHNKWPVAVIAIWYPIIDLKENTHFINVLEKIAFNNHSTDKKVISTIYFNKLQKLKLPENNRILGSKMLIINSPFNFNYVARQVHNIIN